MVNEFLKELDVEGVAEVIAERFDSAIDFMHSNAVVYGGAIRDVLAEMPLEGDLDIATDGYSHKFTIRNFRKSTKWTEQGRRWRSPRPSTKLSTRRTASVMPELLREASSSPYKSAGMPVADITSFITFDKAKTQIVMAKGKTKDSSDAALEIIRHVDFVCCGLMMDNTGRVFEIIEGAYEDCKNKVLRLNKAVKDINVDNLKERIAKLKKRGWESKINVSAIKRKMEKAHKARIADQERLAKSQHKHMAKSSPHEKATKICSFIKVKESKAGIFKNYSVHFSRRNYTKDHIGKNRDFPGLAQILDVMSEVAYTVKMKIAHKPGSGDDIIIHILESRVTSKRASYFAKELQHALEQLAHSHGNVSKKDERFALSYGGVSKKTTEVKKKRRTSEVYKSYADSTDNHSGAELSDKLRGRSSSRAGNSDYFSIPAKVPEPEAVARAERSPDDADVETMSFKATMTPDGQIAISPSEVDLNTTAGEVTIDVDSLPPEAAQQLKSALENMGSERLDPLDVMSLAEMSLEEQDSVDVKAMGEERSEDADDIYPLLEIGADPDERDRR